MKSGWRLLCLAVCCCAPVLAQSFPAADALRQARATIADIYALKTAALWKNLSPDMQEQMKSETDLEKLDGTLKFQLGEESSIRNERVVPGPHTQIYTRSAIFTGAPLPIIVMVSFNDEGQVAGLYFRPQLEAAQSKHLDYKDLTEFTLPVQGEWLIYQGGRSTYDNYHADYVDQRFAYDFVGIENGKLYSGNGDKPEDYFGFGKPVFAPAAGKVVAVADKYEDNPIQDPSSKNPREGNHIVIEHDKGEFSMLGQLKRGSIQVKVGQKIKAGERDRALRK